MSRKTWYVLMNALIGLWALAAIVVVLVHRYVPLSGWLMVHVLLLGAASTAILIWSQHFADTLLRHPAAGGRRAHGARLALHTVGAGVVVAGMLRGAWPVVLAGGTLVALVAVLQGASLLRQMRSALPSRFGPLVRYYVAASGALVIGVTLGVIMSRADVAPPVHDRLYLAHVGFNVLGWVGLTVIGTVILLWPTVLHASITAPAEKAGRRALPILSAALVLLGLASFADLHLLVSVALAGYLVGLGLVLWSAIRQARSAPPATYASWSMGAALGWFFGCVLAFAVVSATTATIGAATEALHDIVLPFVVGFVTQIVVAALSYLLPVVLGGGPTVAKQTGRELDRGAVFRVIVINSGLLLSRFPLPSLVKVTLSLLVFGALVAFLVLVVRAVLVSRRSREGAAAAPRTVAPASRPSAPATPPTRSGMIVAATGALVLAVALGVSLDPAAAGIDVASGSAGQQVVATGHTTVVAVSMKDLRFTPDRVEVLVGDRLVITLNNADTMVHDLTLANGVSSGRLGAGESARVDVGIISGDIAGWCSVAAHRQWGMVFSVAATGTAGEASEMPAMPGMDHGSTPSASATAAASDVDLMKEPSAGFTARDAALQPAPAVKTHRVTFTVRDTETEVAPGVTQLLWTYNGTAPGPTLRGHVGDSFEVTLRNESAMGHSIDFHAGALAPDGPMRTIGPGEELTYRFTATRSGIWLYHCSTMPMSMHIANGMFGAVIIDPPDLAPVDREYLLVQSEMYLGAEGGIANAEALKAEDPDLVVFNGYADQYRYRPLDAHVGERVRVWVLDAGPDRSAAFHVVGGQFDTTFLEGDYLLRDDGSTGTGGAQALALQAGQGGFVELAFPEKGTYPFVNHVMLDAERGATASFHVTE